MGCLGANQTHHPLTGRSHHTMPFPPTPEQQTAIDAAMTGGSVVLEAGAGTGKTTTLTGIAAAKGNQRGIYVAYNKAIANEARAKFPDTVDAMTMHSIAYRWANQRWGSALRERLNAPRMPANESMRLLGVMRSPLMVNERGVIQPFTLMRLAMDTVRSFCYSADPAPARRHVPVVRGAEDPDSRALVIDTVLPLARKAWADLCDPRGRLRYEHDHYLKQWALTNPTLDYDYLLFDEAQDANPLVGGVVDNQGHLQRIAVGDSCQAIYGWRGATDYLTNMDADHRLLLTQSFRFGQPVADEANKWLTLLGAKLRLVGAPPAVVESRIARLSAGQVDAVLCRTNAEAVRQLMSHHEAGVRVALVGGGNEIASLAKAADELKTTRRTSHAELVAFSSWGQVQEYVEQDAAGGDLKVAVNLIDEYGTDRIIDAIHKAVPEGPGVVTVSTAHKSKGREWGRVFVAGDFRQPAPDEKGNQVMPSREDMMLAYVTVTRAQQVLDPTGLAWVSEYLAPEPPRVPRVVRPALVASSVW